MRLQMLTRLVRSASLVDRRMLPSASLFRIPSPQNTRRSTSHVSRAWLAPIGVREMVSNGVAALLRWANQCARHPILFPFLARALATPSSRFQREHLVCRFPDEWHPTMRLGSRRCKSRTPERRRRPRSNLSRTILRPCSRSWCFWFVASRVLLCVYMYIRISRPTPAPAYAPSSSHRKAPPSVNCLLAVGPLITHRERLARWQASLARWRTRSTFSPKVFFFFRVVFP